MRRFSLTSAAWAILVGGCAMYSDVVLAYGGDPIATIIMPYHASAALVLLGASVLLLTSSPSAWKPWAARGLALLVALAGWLTFADHISDLDFSSFWPFFQVDSDDRLGDPATSLKMILLSSGILLMRTPGPALLTRTELVVLPALMMSVQSILGYCYRAASFIGSGYHDDLIYMFTGFGGLGISILLLQGEVGLVHLLTSRRSGRVLLKVLVFPSAILLSAAGWAALEALRYAVFSRPFILAFIVTFGVLLMMVLTTWTVILLQRLERSREQATEKLKQMYETARAAREEAENALHTKEQLLAMVSHELRTPLMPVLMALGSLKQRAEGDPVQLGTLQLMERNIRQEARLIDELLQYSALAFGKGGLEFSNMNLEAVVREAVETTAPLFAQKKVTLRWDGGSSSSWMKGDAARLQQVFLNLLKNAEKFTRPGGWVEVRMVSRNETVGVEIRDTGVGMTSDEMERIFDPFYQSPDTEGHAARGLGLGLAIAKSIVEGHNGSIRVYSAGRERGSSFMVEFPRHQTRRFHPQPGAPAKDPEHPEACSVS